MGTINNSKIYDMHQNLRHKITNNELTIWYRIQQTSSGSCFKYAKSVSLTAATKSPLTYSVVQEP